jgi:transcription termination/antitermination protein NusG
MADLEGSLDHNGHGYLHGGTGSTFFPAIGSGYFLADTKGVAARTVAAAGLNDRQDRRGNRDGAMAKRWYIVHAYSNFEKKVAKSIEERAKSNHLEHLFEEILVPTEDVVEVRRGRKIQAERKFFPGYVLVKMEMTDAGYHLIKNTPKVSGFLGTDNRPIAISEEEAMRILHQVKEGVERPKPSVTFEIGEQVRVADGPFASFQGHVEEVDEERARLKVAVSIFGRPTPVELEFGQVEKVA